MNIFTVRGTLQKVRSVATSWLPLSPRRAQRERDSWPPSAGEARGMNEVIDGFAQPLRLRRNRQVCYSG